MTKAKWSLLLVAGAVLLATGWLWWVKPKKVDMAAYAPATSLVYLESNQPTKAVESITKTDAWKIVDASSGSQTGAGFGGWFQRFVGWTGIGPVNSVILARSQIALVITELAATEEGDSLRVKSEGAVIIETHTWEGRIRTPVENAVKQLAEKTYGQPTLKRTTVDGIEFVEWTAPSGDRRIVLGILGSLVIVGNTEHAVRTCLATARGLQPNLKDDPELARMRRQLAAGQSLAFGYAPPANTPKLLSFGIPILLGRTPGNSDLQRLLTTGAAKVLGSIGWSIHPFATGMEDRYLISVRPEVVDRLKPNFSSTHTDAGLQQLLPGDAYSLTRYKFKNPDAVWEGMKTAVASQVDTLSAVLFSTLMKSALLDYGIDQPEKFLALVKDDVVTVRLTADGEHTLLIARARDRDSMVDFLTTTMAMVPERPGQNVLGETLEDPKREIAAVLKGDFVLIGPSASIRQYQHSFKSGSENSTDERLRRITYFSPPSSSATITTYTDDSDRVRSFVSAAIAAKGGSPVSPDRVSQLLSTLPYAATETSLVDVGFQRITKSPLGQFSALLPLVVPDRPAGPSPSQ